MAENGRRPILVRRIPTRNPGTMHPPFVKGRPARSDWARRWPACTRRFKRVNRSESVAPRSGCPRGTDRNDVCRNLGRPRPRWDRRQSATLPEFGLPPILIKGNTS